MPHIAFSLIIPAAGSRRLAPVYATARPEQLSACP